MTCPRCADLGDAALAVARNLEPLIVAAVRAHLERTRIGPVEAPPGLTKAEARLFTILFNAHPNPATYESIFYYVGDSVRNIASLKELLVRIRKKAPDYSIKHVPGVGYVMTWETAG